MTLANLISKEKDFFQQAKESLETDFQRIADITNQCSIVTTKNKDIYTTAITDLSHLQDAHEGKRTNTVFASTSTTSFNEAIVNHYSSMEYLKRLGY
jgi:hypothetical protein